MNLNNVIFDIETDTMQGAGGFKYGEMAVTYGARNTGKSNIAIWYNNFLSMKNDPVKIQWERSNPQNPLQLSAYSETAPQGYVNFIQEEDMVAVADWCSTCNCGKRTSFDTFRFKNEKQVTMFLMKWCS